MGGGECGKSLGASPACETRMLLGEPRALSKKFTKTQFLASAHICLKVCTQKTIQNIEKEEKEIVENCAKLL